MRRRVLARCLAAAAAAACAAVTASAQPAPPGVAAAAEPGAAPAPPLVLGHGALPGGLHAPTADTLPGGMFAFTATGGYGWRGGLVGDEHRLGRRLGGVGLAFAPTGGLSIALALDGRHDRHAGVTPDGDDSYVG